MLIVDGMFDYTDNRFPAGYDCSCRLRVWEFLGGSSFSVTGDEADKGRWDYAVMATDLAQQNKGASVTNTAERWAAEAVAEYGVDPRKTVFIDHYDRREGALRSLSIARTLGLANETFDFVEFEWLKNDDGKWFAFKPKWHPVSRERLESILGPVGD